jgi:psiF repeat
MKKLIAWAVLGASLVLAPMAFAGPQQEKMKVCSKTAKTKSLKGAERKAFMKKCLSKKYKIDASGKLVAASSK